MKEEIVLICEPLRFYSENDEFLLFQWLEKIKSVDSIYGVGNSLHLKIGSREIPNSDLLDLMGVFERYKFDSKQLIVFKNEKNEKFFS